MTDEERQRVSELMHAAARSQRDPQRDPVEHKRLMDEVGKITVYHMHTHKDGRRVA